MSTTFPISNIAKEKSERIVASVPKGGLAKGIRLDSLHYRIDYKGCEEEKKRLSDAARRHNARNTDDDYDLLAHGTQTSASLCQILIDGRLRHLVCVENYGDLGVHKKNTSMGGYYDHGWGVFVALGKSLNRHREEACNSGEQFMNVPLSELEAIVMPQQVAGVVRKEFPQYANLIKSYKEFSEELEKNL